MDKVYYSSSIMDFIKASTNEILGSLSRNNQFSTVQQQTDAWLSEIKILKNVLAKYNGDIYLEYSIPRMGERIDAVLIIKSVIFVIEFKVNENKFTKYGYDQVWDYALDLKNFHEPSHNKFIAPILISTNANVESFEVVCTPHEDKLLYPIKSNENLLSEVISKVLFFSDEENIDVEEWHNGRYCPTPTIIEAAKALYKNHSVKEISRNDASAINLTKTTDEINEVIIYSKENKRKSICFITGVPGSGKTLVGLNIATKHLDHNENNFSVFLSGNGPLVNILQEALARDLQQQEKVKGNKITKKVARSRVKAFIQNVHHYRDAYLSDLNAPIDHVAIFDEAQRAWDIEKTIDFMKRKKNYPNFDKSESEFLISCIDRHEDWGVIICLVGGGQEIHRGEAGISEWLKSVGRSFQDWDIYISSRLSDKEYSAVEIINRIRYKQDVYFRESMHLSVSLRSYRAENVSLLVKQILDINIQAAQKTLETVSLKYPIVITRDLTKAKKWLRLQARGSERYGLIVSSQAERLKPHCIDVKSPMDPIHWFLDDKEDVRSSFYLEAVATEFQIQGLELDWVCVTWDADFRYTNNGWDHRSFRGSKWNYIRKDERKLYQINAYRVLLTRARQGMVIVVPEGDEDDHTRLPEFYNPTFEFLSEIGFKEI